MADKYVPGMEFQSWRSLPRGPLADVGAAAKTGLMLYGLHKIGAIDALNKIGIKQNSQGGWGYKAPESAPVGSVVPTAPVAAAPVAPVPPAQQAVPDATGTEMAAPVMPQSNIEATPLPSMNAPAEPSPDVGHQLLNNEFHGEAEDQFKSRDVAQDQLPQQFAQGVAPPISGYPQPPQSNGGLLKLLAAFG